MVARARTYWHGPPRLPHRPHRIQRRLARALARQMGADRARLRARSLHRRRTSSRSPGVGSVIEDIRGDIRDARQARTPPSPSFKPDVVFHLAAQPLVRYSLRRPHRHLRDQRHRHRARAGRRAPHAQRPRRRQRHHRQVLREQGVALGLSRNRSARRLRSLLQLQGLRGDRLSGLPPVLLPCRRDSRHIAAASPLPAPATSSAAATGPPTASSPTSSAASSLASRCASADPTRSAPGSTCWSRCSATSGSPKSC